MTTKTNNSTASTAQSIAKLFAIGTLATGAVAAISAAPAGAVILGTTGVNTNQQLNFNGYTQDFYQNVITSAGPSANFSINFSQGTAANINTAAGSPTGSQLNTLFPGGTIPVNPVTGNFAYVSGSGTNLTYRLNNPSDLTFSFGNGFDYVVKSGTTFNSFLSSTGGLEFNLASDGGAFFRDRSNGDITQARTTAFQFTDLPAVVGTNFAGNYQIIASPVAVPEPFTIIGTVIGGTAALRMRKRLKAENK